MYSRKSTQIISELLNDFRIVYLTGPRQAGKTTLVKETTRRSDMIYISLDDSALLTSAQVDPHGFIRSFGSKNVVIDEFQYTPDLIPAIKGVSDNLNPGQTGKFLLTGSTDIFRSAKTQEALPGHMARVELYPLSLSEIFESPLNIIDYILTGKFSSTASLFRTREEYAGLIISGGYPEVQKKSERAKQVWFRSYMAGRLYKDFENLYAARGDYYSKIQTLIPYLAGISSNLLKYGSVSNDLEMDEKTIKSYIEILNLMFIVGRLPAYSKNRSKRLVRMPKLQFIDTGLACHLLGLRTPEQTIKQPILWHFA